MLNVTFIFLFSNNACDLTLERVQGIFLVSDLTQSHGAAALQRTAQDLQLHAATLRSFPAPPESPESCIKPSVVV